ncbi:NrfD/PsrC family molybdoenzyme membrane anchor subunit [Rodentibacter ratti]|nr:NrfD/PsrC family molybdoenzyme membrane anchor subunit [Rodentibacter ratti]
MIREILVEPQHIAWLPWAVSYFFFAGIATTAVLSALAMRIFKQATLQQELIAVAIALSCAVVAPIALMADLHQPTRFWHLFTVATYWSWMWWGAYILPSFIIALFGYFLFLFRQVRSKTTYFSGFALNTFRILALLTSVLMLLYTCMEVYKVETRPLWHHHWLMPLIVFSALPTTALLIKENIQLRTKQSLNYLRRWALVGLLFFASSVVGLVLSKGETALQFTQLYNQNSLSFFTALLAVAMVFSGFIPSFALRMGLTVLFGIAFTWSVRWILLIQVQSIAKYNALANPYSLEWNADGVLGIVAMIGLWSLVSVVIWQVLNTTEANMLQSKECYDE